MVNIRQKTREHKLSDGILHVYIGQPQIFFILENVTLVLYFDCYLNVRGKDARRQKPRLSLRPELGRLFNDGETTAFLKSFGKQPSASDSLTKLSASHKKCDGWSQHGT